MEISSFRGFFSSLAQITHLNYEIWNGNGFVFSSGSDRSKMPGTKDLQDLSRKIITHDSFQYILAEGQYTVFGVPVKYGEETIGSLIAHGPENDREWRLKGKVFSQRSFIKEIELFLTYLAGLLKDKWTSQKETEELAEELALSFSDLYLYNRIAARLRSLKFSGNMLQDLIEDLLDTMRVDLAFAELPGRSEYNVVAVKAGLSQKVSDQKAFIEGLLSSIPHDASSLEEHYFTISDSREIPGFAELYPEPYRFLAVDLKHNNVQYGWLGMVSFNLEEIFRRSELRLMSMMAEQIAVVIANSELYGDLERFVINVVRSLIQAIEAKDVYTRGHSERVNQYSTMMADSLQMEEKEREDLHWASMLHDVGKIGIPEAILNKPDLLTDEEYNIIKGHPQKGWDILEPIEQLRGALSGILLHHERIDGRGYPRGLKGEEISLTGRIIAVADTFDAITSDRAYRSGKSPEEALTIMEEAAGTQLDPHLVRVFKGAYGERPVSPIDKTTIEDTHERIEIFCPADLVSSEPVRQPPEAKPVSVSC